MELNILQQKDSFYFYEKNTEEYVGNLKYLINYNNLFIINYYIKPNFRKKNLSKQIFEYLFNFCKNNQIEKIELVVKELFESFGKLVNFYKKYGFEIDDNREIYLRWREGEMFRFVSMVKIL